MNTNSVLISLIKHLALSRIFLLLTPSEAKVVEHSKAKKFDKLE